MSYELKRRVAQGALRFAPKSCRCEDERPTKANTERKELTMGSQEPMVSVKYFRRPPGDHSSYSAAIDGRLDELLGTDRARATLRLKNSARVPGTSVVVERHENGPLIFGIPLIDLAAYAGTLATIASLWLQMRDRRKTEPSHEV